MAFPLRDMWVFPMAGKVFDTLKDIANAEAQIAKERAKIAQLEASIAQLEASKASFRKDKLEPALRDMEDHGIYLGDDQKWYGPGWDVVDKTTRDYVIGGGWDGIPRDKKGKNI